MERDRKEQHFQTKIMRITVMSTLYLLKGTLSELRGSIKAYPELDDALCDSMSNPMITEVQATKVKGNNVPVKQGVLPLMNKWRSSFNMTCLLLTKDALTAKGLKSRIINVPSF